MKIDTRLYQALIEAICNGIVRFMQRRADANTIAIWNTLMVTNPNDERFNCLSFDIYCRMEASSWLTVGQWSAIDIETATFVWREALCLALLTLGLIGVYDESA